MPVKVRISLSEQDFRDLVAGKVVKPEGFRMIREKPVLGPIVEHEAETGTVEIALQDIGWDRMYAAIDTAMGNRGE